MSETMIGRKVPSFSLESDAAQTVTERDWLGKKIILYFYPKDNTPGCSVEAQQFNAALVRLADAGYTVVGVSRDTVKRHVNFKNKYELKFTLLADTDEILCRAFDVMKEKKLYGKVSIGIERSTFVIDEEGTIVREYRGVKAKEHVEALLKDLGIDA